MVKRGIKIKQISVGYSVYERFRSFEEYGEPNEKLLEKIMDMADKYKKFSTTYRNKGVK
jgi:hypothetical protein